MSKSEKTERSEDPATAAPDAGRHRWPSLAERICARLQSDRGDVPGWVLVAVMTAGLVTTLWVVADEQLAAVLQKAIADAAGG